MSLLRNVLTYMGLGPDEDYDDGYLYEATDDTEIDLTDPVDDVDFGQDAHELRERPDWLGLPLPDKPASKKHKPAERKQISIDDDDPELNGEAATSRLDDEKPAVRALRAVPEPSLEPQLDGTDGSFSDESFGVEPETKASAERAEPPLPEVDKPEPATPAGESDRSKPDRSKSDRSKSDRSKSERPDPKPVLVKPKTVKPRSLAPKSFGDAKTLADDFKEDVPVVMNLQGVDRDLARRLIDFASGICYVLDGGMEKIAPQVFLLTPKAVVVSDEDRRRLEQRGFGS